MEIYCFLCRFLSPLQVYSRKNYSLLLFNESNFMQCFSSLTFFDEAFIFYGVIVKISHSFRSLLLIIIFPFPLKKHFMMEGAIFSESLSLIFFKTSLGV